MTPILVTGASGYVGNIVCSILKRHSIEFEICGHSSSGNYTFSLENLFARHIPEGTIVFHSAFSHKWKDNKGRLNEISLEQMATFLNNNNCKLVLIGSTSGIFPWRSDYASTKFSQELSLQSKDFGTVLRVGILVEENNFFLRMIRNSSRLSISFYGRDSNRLFAVTTLDMLEERVIECVEERDYTQFAVKCAYDQNKSFLTFVEVQEELGDFKYRRRISIPVTPILALLRPLRKFDRFYRLYNSIKFIA